MISSRQVIHEKLSRAALGLALLLLPFTIKGCHIALIAFLILWILEGAWRKKYERLRITPLLYVLFAFALINIVGLTYSSNSAEAWFTLEKKVFLFLIPLALATTSVSWEGRHVRILCYVFLAACMAGIIVCVISASLDFQNFREQDAFTPHVNYLHGTAFESTNAGQQHEWLFYSYAGLSNGINIHPTYFALYLAFCLVFLIHERLTRQHTKWIKAGVGATICILIVTIVFLSSKIITLSLMVIFMLGGAVYLLRAGSRKHAIKLALVSIAILLLVILNPVSRYRSWQEMTNSSFQVKEDHVYTTSVEMRASLWWLGWKAYEESNLLFGTGPGDVKGAIKKVGQEYNITNTLGTFDPHSQYLFILIANGIVGLTLFLLYLIMVSVKAIGSRNYLMMAATLLFAFLCFTESALELQKGIIFFTIIHSVFAFAKASIETSTQPLTLSGAAN